MLDTNTLIFLIKSQPPAVAQRVDAWPEGATVVTNNTREFQRVEGLRLEDGVAAG